MTEKVIPEQDFYSKLRSILYQNTKNIENMWERICTEVKTPDYPHLPTEKEINERLDCVVRERNKIIREELRTSYTTLANLIKTGEKEEVILDLCKLVLSKWLDKEKFLEDKIGKYI